MGTSTHTTDFPPVQTFLNGGSRPTLNDRQFRAQVDVALASAEHDRLSPN